ncbi:HipA domain-containing protein [Christiangramia portivictoriae]|uniref:HipA domain-containing protein n=1 Tax=Christiangramia portivictoriae TaxID=326069 RepID=UPI0004222BCD|nr:HipA domain-containing protein [Christiangramia portivictoriae]
MLSKLTQEKIINYSGIQLTHGQVKPVKRKNYNILTESVGGDAPKDVIKLYEYERGKVRRDKQNLWKKYIAKIGHKWYPNESITEHFFTSIGQSFGIDIANSKIIYAENYIRFLSEHFHNSEQSLIHGANILSRYMLESDTKWLDELDQQRHLKGEINIKDVLIALEHVFPQVDILNAFIDMLIFDCLIGNNDRHYYNWGVVTHIRSRHEPYFSPIYDTARGLYWNRSEEFILSLQNEKGDRQDEKIEKYINNSVPKISIPNNKKCNHFQLIAYLKQNGYINTDHINRWTCTNSLEKTLQILDISFGKLFTTERREIIKKVLNLRFQTLKNIL